MYLHCDPTASHYLQVLTDAVFGPTNFVNEITWQRTLSHGNVGRNFGKVTDQILFCAKTPDHQWNQGHAPYSEAYVEGYFRYSDDRGRYRTVSLRNPSPRPNLRYDYTASNGTTYKPHPNRWAVNEVRMRAYDEADMLYSPSKPTGSLLVKQYLTDKPGVKVQNLWDDIPPIGAHAAERLGYPTQKPLALLERRGTWCSTRSVIAGRHRRRQKLGRRWVGIDVTYLAVDLIRKRLCHTYGLDIEDTYTVRGIPTDVEGAAEVFRHNPFDCERWAVSLVNAQPNQKQVGDRGVDGRVRFHAGKISSTRSWYRSRVVGSSTRRWSATWPGP